MKQITDADFGIVEAMQGAPVLVVGDIMLDRFIYGRVERISPESPVPVLSVSRESKMMGGAGNTLSNLIELGCDAQILSVIGDDKSGEDLCNVLQERGVDASGLLVSNKRMTTEKTRFLAGHQQLLRTDYERVEPAGKEIEAELLKRAESILKNIRVMVLSDYGKGLLSRDLVGALITLANKANVKVLVDPKGVDYSIYAGAYAVTPNKKELHDVSKLPVDTDEDVIAAAQKVIAESSVENVIATRSQDGMSIITQDGEPVHIRSAANIEVFDVSGAGDTVIATIAATLATGASLVKAAFLANIAGSIVVSKVGTAPIRRDDFKAYFERGDFENAPYIDKTGQQPRIERMRQAPMLDWDSAKEEVARWRARGLKIGFTNGCFDIVHLGHVNYLNEARSMCDRLIVGLNHDKSVKLLKGEERPIHSEEGRAAVLGALGSVDLVCLFGATEQGGDNTASALLEIIQPDVYFKGGDYTVDTILEAPTVQRYGGEVHVMPIYEGHSSSNSIKKIRDTDKKKTKAA